MTFTEIFTIICEFASAGAMLFFIPFLMFVVFPFVQSFSPEKRLERLVDEQCIKGNEVAIKIRRENLRYYTDRDYKLIKEAINGNQNAIRALKLDDSEPRKHS